MSKSERIRLLIRALAHLTTSFFLCFLWSDYLNLKLILQNWNINLKIRFFGNQVLISTISREKVLIFGGKYEKDAIPGWKGDFFAFLSLDSYAPWFFVLEIYIYYDTVWYLIFEQIVIFIDTDLQPCPGP